MAEQFTSLDEALQALSVADDASDDSTDILFTGESDLVDSPLAPKKRPASKKKSKKKRSNSKDSSGLKDTVAAITGSAWAMSGHFLAENGPEPAGKPVGRVMQFQAPLAGRSIAEILDHTPLLKLFAPLSDNSGLIGSIASLIGPPLIVGLMASNDKAMQMGRPMLGMFMVPMAKEIIKAQKSMADNMGAMGEIDEETSEMVSNILNALFGSDDTDSRS